MAIAQVGSFGTVATAAANNVTPSFAQATKAGNLLVAIFGGDGTGSVSTCSDSSWVKAIEIGNSGTFGNAAIWYKPNCGAGETAPTFTNNGSSTTWGELSEWSGSDLVPLDQTKLDASGGGATSLTSTANAADAKADDLLISAMFISNSKSATYTITTTFTPSGGTTTSLGNTGGTKATSGFGGSSYLLGPNHGGGAADAAAWGATPSTGTSNVIYVVLASFKSFTPMIPPDTIHQTIPFQPRPSKPS